MSLLGILFIQIGWAQQKTVTGNVTDENGLPLPGATIVIENTINGVTSDFDGNYSITASEGETLIFSYVGYSNSKIIIGAADNYDISLQPDNLLEEVVVTSLGIKREKKALGYAVSEVNSQDLEQRGEGDIARVLSGKASGVQITNQSGISGSGTSIVIRGFNTFSQGNQPLFIVDGVPFSSETNASGREGERQDFVNGNNGSSRFLDIDPNNIESVNVLKGLAAATLYGTQGRNGVILITTKSGLAAGGTVSKNEVTVNSSYFNVDIASLPDYQNQYGNGFDQSFGWFFSNWGPSFDKEGPAGWAGQNSINGTLSGAPGFLKHPFTTASGATGIPAVLDALGIAPDATYEWKPYNNVRQFFRTGHAFSNNINIKSTNEEGTLSYNINYGNLEDQGFTRANTLRRNTLSFGGNAQLANKLSLNGTLNFTQTNFKSPPVAAGLGSNVSGEGASVFANVFYTPRSIDLMGLPYQNPVTGESIYYRQNNSIQHPLWTVNNTGNSQITNRVFGGVSLGYGINDNLNISYRYGIDVYSENNVNFSNKGGKTGTLVNRNGIYETWNNTKTINDHNLTLSGDYKFNDFGVTFNLGGTSRSDIFDRNGVRSTGQQVFNVLRHFNFEQQNEIQDYTQRNIIGLYGQADIDYKSFVYLTLAGRKDWVSNLAEENRSILYPSASISFLPTSAFQAIKSDWVSFLKVRAGYGTSANFPLRYPIASTLTLDTQSFIKNGNQVIANTSGTILGNPNLRPERIDEVEFGLEGSFLQNSISLDLSIYNKITKDLIIDQPLDPSTGYSETKTNIGKIENKGIELDLSVDWLKAISSLSSINIPQDFNWSTSLNWSTNDAIVLDLGQDTDKILYSGYSNLGNVAIPGESLGSIMGSSITRDSKIKNYRWLPGNFVVNNQGSYDETNDLTIIGDANQDWVLNISNSISYKGFNFSFLINHVHGGDVYSATVATLLGRGLTTDTLDRELSFILPGVLSNGSPNQKQINNSTFYFSNVLYGPDEMRVYDGSLWRLGEISLSYNLPKKLLENTPFGMVSLSISGFNLWYNAYNMPKGTNFDPNIVGTGVGNGRGFDFLNGPSSKRFGGSLKLTF